MNKLNILTRLRPAQTVAQRALLNNSRRTFSASSGGGGGGFSRLIGLTVAGLGGYGYYQFNQPKPEIKDEAPQDTKEAVKESQPVTSTPAAPVVEKKEAAPTKEAAPKETPKEEPKAEVVVTSTGDFNEVELTDASKMEDGEMMEVKVGSGKQDKVLVAKFNGEVYAIGAYCSHFGAPLAKGVLFDDKVLCPYHAAGFSVKTGALEFAPGRDGVPSYPVTQKDGKYFVTVPKKMEKKQVANMAKRDPENKTKMVIIGGGAAGLNCAETLRQSDFTGEIIVLSEEKSLPYDRTLLSKQLAKGNADKWSLRETGFMDTYDIDYQLGYKAVGIDKANKEVTLADGSKITYDKLLIATGGRATKPPTPGIDLENVFLLRTNEDQAKIKKEAAKAKNIVVVGAGFIGSETVANLQKTYAGKKNVHMVCDAVPMEKYFGYDVGSMFLHEHDKNGAKVYVNHDLTKIKYDGEGKVNKVVLESGYEIPADLVIVGAGLTPNVELAQEAGLSIDNRGVKTNPFLQTSDPDIFAAGDIAAFPNWHTGTTTRIEHWIAAQDQGSYAAFNMLGKMVPYGNIPFFWTNHYGKGMQYCGHATEWDSIHIDGVPRDNKFLAYYIKNDKVLAIAGQGRNNELLGMFEAMQQNEMPPASSIVNGAETPSSISKRLKLNRGGGICRRANCCQKKSIVQ